MPFAVREQLSFVQKYQLSVCLYLAKYPTFKFQKQHFYINIQRYVRLLGSIGEPIIVRCKSHTENLIGIH